MTQLGKLATVGAMLVLLELANLLEQLLGLLLLLSGHTSILSKEKSCAEKNRNDRMSRNSRGYFQQTIENAKPPPSHLYFFFPSEPTLNLKKMTSPSSTS